MVTSIKYTNFKALESFSIALKSFNVLTGPNNSGKSTLLDGLRILEAVYRYVSRLNPKRVKNPFGSHTLGYEIPGNIIPLKLENIQTNLNNNDPSYITYTLSGHRSLTIYFHPDHPIFLFFDTPNKPPKTASDFRAEFPLSISIIPTLGPLELEEQLLDINYVKYNYGGRRSARMFRSFWFYNPENFEEFRVLVEQTWPGMTITRPQKKDAFSKDLFMFFEESRFPREICWAGFGFQIWLQLLTHVVNNRSADLLVVDEPEVYLHPDLQHKILDILKLNNASVLLATHSVEIINSVEPSEVVLIDKRNRSAKRISDLAGLQQVSNLLGSGHNIELTRLARGKKILFVEGKDVKLLNRLAKACRRDAIFADSKITIIPIDGFSQYEKIIHTNWAFTKILGEELKIGVLLDRDYRTTEEVELVEEKISKEVDLVHILKRKEIENYFLVPIAIQKAILQRLQERPLQSEKLAPEIADVKELLLKLSNEFRADVFGQILGNRLKQKSSKDVSTIVSETTQEFENLWKDLEYRLTVIPGKHFIAKLNSYLQEYHKISITYYQIASHLNLCDLDSEIVAFFNSLVDFKNKLT